LLQQARPAAQSVSLRHSCAHRASASIGGDGTGHAARCVLPASADTVPAAAGVADGGDVAGALCTAAVGGWAARVAIIVPRGGSEMTAGGAWLAGKLSMENMTSCSGGGGRAATGAAAGVAAQAPLGCVTFSA